MKNIQTKSKRAGEPAKGRARVKRGKKVANDKLRKAEVELLRDLFEHDFWSFDALAEKFEISVSRAKSIATYKQSC